MQAGIQASMQASQQPSIVFMLCMYAGMHGMINACLHVCVRMYVCLQDSASTTASDGSEPCLVGRIHAWRMWQMVLFIPENPSGVGFSFSAPTRGARYRALS